VEETLKPQRDKQGRYVGKTRAPVEDDLAFVTLELHRPSGHVTIHDEFAYPGDVWFMCNDAAIQAAERSDRVRGRSEDDD
jgi:hypothetical protein